MSDQIDASIFFDNLPSHQPVLSSAVLLKLKGFSLSTRESSKQSS